MADKRRWALKSETLTPEERMKRLEQGKMGVFFGSGEHGRMNMVYSLTLLPLIVYIIAFVCGQESRADKLLSLAMLGIGYFVGTNNNHKD